MVHSDGWTRAAPSLCSTDGGCRQRSRLTDRACAAAP